MLARKKEKEREREREITECALPLQTRTLEKARRDQSARIDATSDAIQDTCAVMHEATSLVHRR